MDGITPFFALPPDEIRARVDALEHPAGIDGAHAILEIKDGEQLPWAGATWRPAIPETWDIMLDGIVPYLPDLRVAVFLHDGPMANLDAEAKRGYTEAALEGKREFRSRAESGLTAETLTSPWPSPHAVVDEETLPLHGWAPLAPSLPPLASRPPTSC